MSVLWFSISSGVTVPFMSSIVYMSYIVLLFSSFFIIEILNFGSVFWK